MDEEAVEVPKHHIRQGICATRKAYRDGKQDTAVKVYTISKESQYLMITGVPAVGASEELVKLCALYGQVDEYRILDEYPVADPYTEVYWVKFKKLQAARVAKRKLDDYSFFGGILHVFYCPEYETVDDTRQKLATRRRWVSSRIRAEEAQRLQSTVSNSQPTTYLDVIEPVRPKTSQRPQSGHVTTTRSTNQQREHDRVTSLNTVIKGVDYSTVPLPQTERSSNAKLYRNTGDITNGDGNDIQLQKELHERFFVPPRHDLRSYPSNRYLGSSLDEDIAPWQIHHWSREDTDKVNEHTGKTLLNRKYQDTTGNRPCNSNRDGNASRTENIGKCSSKTGQKEAEKNVFENEEKVIHGVKIKPFNSKTMPKFVPRQVVKNVHTGEKVKKKDDDLDAIIKRNAYVLGPVSGPSPRTGTLRNESSQEDISIEKTRAAIREKIKQFCPTLWPRQLRKRKMEENRNADYAGSDVMTV